MACDGRQGCENVRCFDEGAQNMVGYTGSTSVTQWELHLFYIWILSTIFEVAWACDVFAYGVKTEPAFCEFLES